MERIAIVRFNERLAAGLQGSELASVENGRRALAGGRTFQSSGPFVDPAEVGLALGSLRLGEQQAETRRCQQRGKSRKNPSHLDCPGTLSSDPAVNTWRPSENVTVPPEALLEPSLAR